MADNPLELENHLRQISLDLEALDQLKARISGNVEKFNLTFGYRGSDDLPEATYIHYDQARSMLGTASTSLRRARTAISDALNRI